jgi:hypothetical protein
VSISKALPEDVLKLADLFWTYTEKEEDHFYGSQIGTLKLFLIVRNTDLCDFSIYCLESH